MGGGDGWSNILHQPPYLDGNRSMRTDFGTGLRSATVVQVLKVGVWGSASAVCWPLVLVCPRPSGASGQLSAGTRFGEWCMRDHVPSDHVWENRLKCSNGML